MISKVQADDYILVDNVYMFQPPNDEKTFYLNFDKNYNYYITFEIVTPNNAGLFNITIFDPEGKMFHVYNRTLQSTFTQGDYDEVPFGVAVSGIHTIVINITTAKNMNVYIRIEKTIRCLEDKVSAGFFDTMKHYDVRRFFNGDKVQFIVDLMDNEMYRISLGRVSSIADLDSIESVHINISDPSLNNFYIYENNGLAGVDALNWTFFGTAANGLYTFTIKVLITEPYINLAYLISDDYSIAQNLEENGTIIESPENEYTTTFSIPIEAGIVMGLIVIGVMACLAVLYLYNKNESKAKLDIRK
ncbi:MAG: hypothetical protein KJI69_06570 [Patescibacteria group bacterium]|nr:hypothetical protein [Patescibacteria group bacterium]